MKKRIEMGESCATNIATKAFEVLSELFATLPPRFSGQGDCGEITIEVQHNVKSPCTKVKGEIRTAVEGKEEDVIVYKVLREGKIYKIELWDTEDAYGYMSCSSHWGPDTYVFCNFKETRDDGSVKSEMDFAFDIEKRTFVELFSIEYIGGNDLVRECQEIEYFERLLLGVKII